MAIRFTGPDLNKIFDEQLQALEIYGYFREYQLATPRKWRADFAWPNLEPRPIIVEIQGGIYRDKESNQTGWHQTPAGMIKDMEKHNNAVIRGYDVYYFHGKQIRSGNAALFIQSVIDGKPKAQLLRPGRPARRTDWI